MGLQWRFLQYQLPSRHCWEIVQEVSELNRLIVWMHQHLLQPKLEEGGAADGVAVEVSAVSAAILALLGECPGRF